MKQNSVLAIVCQAMMLGVCLLLIAVCQPSQAANGKTCYVEYTGDGVTDGTSADSSAVQAAVNSANAGDTIKVAGTCAGVSARGGVTQTVHISKSLTLQGGYTTTNWLAAPDPRMYPTFLDAQGKGRVLYINNGVSGSSQGAGVTNGDIHVTIAGLRLLNGDAKGLLGGSIDWWDKDSGGGVYILNATAIISDCLISGGAAENGGGIYNGGTATIVDTQVQGNNAVYDGGGLYNDRGSLLSQGHAHVTRSSFFANVAEVGGGIENYGSLTVTNSTLSLNDGTAWGGAIVNLYGTSSIVNSTLGSNSAPVCAGLRNEYGITTLSNSIMDNYLVGSIDCCNLSGGTVEDGGYNLVEDGSCGFPVAGDPMLGAVSFWPPGKTATHPLLPGSPAINGVREPISCTVTTDQRGVPRPQGTRCDIGAYELQYKARCYAEYTGDNLTDYDSNDSQAVQQAVDSVAPEGTVKVAGYCAGVQLRDGVTQTVHIAKSLILRGGYTTTNWLAESDPETHKTTLDAEKKGRVLTINGADGASATNSGGADRIRVYVQGLELTEGDATGLDTQPWPGAGGAIYVEDSEVTLTNGSLSFSKANDGGAIFVTPGNSIEISGTKIYNNTSVHTGAGLANWGSAVVLNSEFNGNRTGSDGGGLGGGIYSFDYVWIEQSRFEGNSAEGGGGGVYSQQDAHIVDSTFYDNYATLWGGGLSCTGRTKITNTTFAENIVSNGSGGGWHSSGDGLAYGCTFYGNSADTGGGVFNDGEILLRNCTISDNNARQGGGIRNDWDAKAELVHGTVAGNSATYGTGGIENHGLFTMTFSIATDSPQGGDCWSEEEGFLEYGHSLVGDGSCTYHEAGDLLLGPLQLNAPGSTATHALLPGSPAIDAIPTGGACYLATDQRGVLRPQGTACDVGAYEFEHHRVFLPVVLRDAGVSSTVSTR